MIQHATAQRLGHGHVRAELRDETLVLPDKRLAVLLALRKNLMSAIPVGHHRVSVTVNVEQDADGSFFISGTLRHHLANVSDAHADELHRCVTKCLDEMKAANATPTQTHGQEPT